jgi:hypothetical protein
MSTTHTPTDADLAALFELIVSPGLTEADRDALRAMAREMAAQLRPAHRAALGMERRRWHATITYTHTRTRETWTVVAPESEGDLQRAQLQRAIDAAAEVIGWDIDADVQLWKTLATVTRKDQSWSVEYDHRGRVRAYR